MIPIAITVPMLGLILSVGFIIMVMANVHVVGAFALSFFGGVIYSMYLFLTQGHQIAMQAFMNLFSCVRKYLVAMLFLYFIFMIFLSKMSFVQAIGTMIMFVVFVLFIFYGPKIYHAMAMFLRFILGSTVGNLLSYIIAAIVLFSALPLLMFPLLLLLGDFYGGLLYITNREKYEEWKRKRNRNR